MSGARTLLCLGMLACGCCFLTAGEAAPAKGERPNILWLSCEDISPDLGCYGVAYAKTPHLDRLAKEGVLYEQAFAITGVCAPNRSCLITGVWPSTLGSHDMRSTTRLPENVKCFSEYLRNAGYYCTNNSKTDYNFAAPKSAWDNCSRQGHWRGRTKGRPFFAVFNYVGTHESQCRKTPRDPKAFPPDKVPIPPFHPDTPEVRGNWAQYHENISRMDAWAKDLLDQLAEDGLAEDTIVFFFSDHGAGLPGCKKWVWEGGLHVPFIVRFPDKYARWAPGKPGTRTDRLVSFVDFAPTVLSLAGVKIPKHMQGRAFLGPQARPPRERVFAIRDRMAERYDTVRVVRDRKSQYMRNYFPQVPWSQFVSYTEQMPTMRVWRRLHEEGKLNAPQERYFTTKPLEELYDCEKDPHQIGNLAGDPQYAEVLERNRKALREWMVRTHDMGLLPESEMHARAEGSTPYEVAFDPQKHPQEELMRVADLANARDPAKLPELVELLKTAADPAVRWWAAVGIVSLGEKARSAEPAVRAALKDDSPLVRVAAAEALCKFGAQTDALPVLEKALQHPTPFIRLRAMNVLDCMGPAAKPLAPAMRKARMKGIMPAAFLSRMTQYVPDRLEGKK